MSVVPQFSGEKTIKNRWPQDRPDKSGPSFWEGFQDSSASDAGSLFARKTPPNRQNKKWRFIYGLYMVYLWFIYGLSMVYIWFEIENWLTSCLLLGSFFFGVSLIDCWQETTYMSIKTTGLVYSSGSLESSRYTRYSLCTVGALVPRYTNYFGI